MDMVGKPLIVKTTDLSNSKVREEAGKLGKEIAKRI